MSTGITDFEIFCHPDTWPSDLLPIKRWTPGGRPTECATVMDDSGRLLFINQNVWALESCDTADIRIVTPGQLISEGWRVD